MKTIAILSVALLVTYSHLMNAQSTGDCKPYISMEGQVYKKITPSNLKLCHELKVSCHEGQEVTWKVLSFQVVRVPKKGDPDVTTSTGASFSKETLEQLKRAREDDVLFFEKIILVSHSGIEEEQNMIVEVY